MKYYIYVNNLSDGKEGWSRAKTFNSKKAVVKAIKVFREFARDIQRNEGIIIKYKITTKLLK